MAKIWFEIYGSGEVEVPDDYTDEDIDNAVFANSEYRWMLLKEEDNDK